MIITRHGCMPNIIGAITAMLFLFTPVGLASRERATAVPQTDTDTIDVDITAT